MCTLKCVIFSAFFVNTLNFTIGGAGGNMGIPPNSTGFKINYYGGSQVIFYNPSYTITFNNAFTPDNNWHNCSTSFNCTHAVVSLDGQTPLVAVSPLLDCGMGTIYAGIGGGMKKFIVSTKELVRHFSITGREII